jgi:hypothetical protein
MFMSVSYPEKTSQRKGFAVENNTFGLGNSERIRLKFGSYGIEVLESGQGIRVSNLYSIDEGVKTNRTFAVVAYPDIIEPEFGDEHDAILNGESIGIVFRNNGWVVDKRHQYFGKIEVPSANSDVDAVFGDIGKIQPVIHVYSLFVKKDNSEFRYASIAEVHHPEYLNLEDLNAIYGNSLDGVLEKNEDVHDFLEIVRTKMGVFHTD